MTLSPMTLSPMSRSTRTLAPLGNVTTAARSARTRLDHAMASSAALVTTYIHTGAERFRDRDDAGMTTAEYAVGVLAAVALAGVLLLVVGEGQVQTALRTVIVDAIQSAQS